MINQSISRQKHRSDLSEEQLHLAGTVVYFELKHWKAKEKKWSTLGWTYMHKEGFLKIVDGEPKVRTEAQGLHLYEKPLDFRSHFRQASMRKMKPLAEVPDLFLRFSEA